MADESWGRHKMIRTLHKLYFIWQLDKEEEWINNMAAHGYAMKARSKLGRYDFEETDAGKYVYKALFLQGSFGNKKNSDYFRFLEEMGIEVVCHSVYPGMALVYTRGKAEDFPEGIELYSDIESKINCLRAMALYLLFVVILCAFVCAGNIFLYFRQNTIHNLIIGSLMLFPFTAGLISMIIRFAQVNKLKKERKIHE